MRKTLIIVISTAVLLVGYTGYRSYSTWKAQHLLSMARAFFAKSDDRNATLSLLALLHAQPQNVEATRLMAADADAHESPTALSWHERVVELDPHSVDDRLALAQTAIRNRDLGVASNALFGVEEPARNTVAYQNLAGQVAIAAGRAAEAQAHFENAIRLDPQNPAPRFSLAVLQIRGSSSMTAAQGRETLAAFAANATNTNLRCQATRELVVDALHRRDTSAALTLSARLLGETNSTFTDRLLRLEVMRQTQDSGFDAGLAQLRSQVASDPGKVQKVGMWQVGKVSPENSLAWFRTLPHSVQTNETVALLIAECCITLQDWKGLEACVATTDWGRLENVRHAFKACSLRGQGLPEASTSEWDKALRLCHDQNSWVTLLHLAAQWKWVPESEDILQQIINNYPSDKWAEQALAQMLFGDGQTRSLMQLYSSETRRNPSDLVAKGDLALTALLLNAVEVKPAEMARELYHASPTNSTVAAAYALSLHLQRKPADAVKVMDALDPHDLENPSIAGYYGIFLQAAGNRAKAQHFLDLGSKAPMLPEERRLFDKARAGA